MAYSPSFHSCVFRVMLITSPRLWVGWLATPDPYINAWSPRWQYCEVLWTIVEWELVESPSVILANVCGSSTLSVSMSPNLSFSLSLLLSLSHNHTYSVLALWSYHSLHHILLTLCASLTRYWHKRDDTILYLNPQNCEPKISVSYFINSLCQVFCDSDSCEMKYTCSNPIG